MRGSLTPVAEELDRFHIFAIFMLAEDSKSGATARRRRIDR
jgi:hypothetical protein